MSNKTQLILVDLTSIKKIEHEVTTHITFKSKEDLKFELKIPFYHIINDEYYYQGTFRKPFGEDFVKKFNELSTDKRIYDINVNSEMREFSCKDPDLNVIYTYKWIDCEIICDHCNESFPWYELISDEIYDEEDDDYIYITDQCPKCKTTDCVTLEFQRFTDYQIEKIISQ